MGMEGMGINILIREESECFYILQWEWDGNGNTVMGMGMRSWEWVGMGSKKSFPHSTVDLKTFRRHKSQRFLRAQNIANIYGRENIRHKLEAIDKILRFSNVFSRKNFSIYNIIIL